MSSSIFRCYVGIQVLSVVGGCFSFNLSEVPGSTGTKMKKVSLVTSLFLQCQYGNGIIFPPPPKKTWQHHLEPTHTLIDLVSGGPAFEVLRVCSFTPLSFWLWPALPRLKPSENMGGVYWSQGCIGNCLKLFFYFYFFGGVKWWIMERDVLLVLLLFPFLTGWWWSRTQIWNMIYMFNMNCTWERCLRRGLLVPCGV